MAQEEQHQKGWFVRVAFWLGRLLIGRLAILVSTVAISAALLQDDDTAIAVPLVILVAIATEIRSLQARRAWAEARRREVERQLAVRQGPMERKYRSAFDPSERVDFGLVKKAIGCCDDGKYEEAIELFADKSVADAVDLDYAALYVRGFARFFSGARKQAKDDFQMSLACLDSERGIVESAMAALYISERQWQDGLAAAERSIENLKRSGRARSWIPYAYKAAIHEMDNDVKTAERVLAEMAPLVQHDRHVRSFLESHPFLQESVKSAAFKEVFN